MRSSPPPSLEECRIAGPEFTTTGKFIVRRGNARLTVIASDGGGWDHVSVSLPTRTPSWEEMCAIKDLFFEPTECVMQLHPPKDENISNHPYCLHLWRPQTAEEIAQIIEDWRADGEPYPYGRESPGAIPRPSPTFVGIPGLSLPTGR
jgi:hypothetical protein